MNVSLQTMMGLRIYRELMEREAKGSMVWNRDFGPEAMLKPPNPAKLKTLGGLQQMASLPSPLTAQLLEVQSQSMKLKVEVDQFEQAAMPVRSIYPISDSSISVWGKELSTSQRPNALPRGPSYPKEKERMTDDPAEGLCPHSLGKPNQPGKRNQWNADRSYFHREQLPPTHLRALKAPKDD